MISRLTGLAATAVLAILLSACSAPAPVSTRDTSALPAAQPDTGTTAQTDNRERILAHYQSWRGTPHRWGGLSRHGIDCSGYILHAYRDLFGRQLPRTTRDQAQLGERVDRGQLRDGDLVFFRTGPDKRHAGIYVGDGRFAHASYSKGVTISSLDNVYWKRTWWQARRLL